MNPKNLPPNCQAAWRNRDGSEAAYTDHNTDFATFKAQRAVPHKGDVPTPDEVIDYAAEVERRERGK